MDKRFSETQKRIDSHRVNWSQRYPGKYLLVCIQTGRFALGNPEADEQGGQIHAMQVFDCKHGTMQASDEQWCTFFGILL